MRFTAIAICTGIASSKGEFVTANGTDTPYDSTTFHLCIDLGEKKNGETIGTVTRPFKLGTSTEIQKWLPLKAKWPAAGIQVECTFELVAGSENSSKPTLVEIRPAPTAKA